MIGRAYLWGLAAAGQPGVENVLDIMRNGIDSALLGLGRSSIHELTPEDLIIPPGFTRPLGATVEPADLSFREDHAADVLAREQVVIALVDLLERVSARDYLVELEVT